MTSSNAAPPAQTLPIACDAYAIPTSERDIWIAKGIEFYAAVEECHELSDGYALRLDARHLILAAEYVSRDRLCCAFLAWEFVVEPGSTPDSGVLWLKLRGPEGTRQFLKHAFEVTALLPEHVATAAGLTSSERRPVNFEGVAAIAHELAPRAKG